MCKGDTSAVMGRSYPDWGTSKGSAESSDTTALEDEELKEPTIIVLWNAPLLIVMGRQAGRGPSRSDVSSALPALPDVMTLSR